MSIINTSAIAGEIEKAIAEISCRAEESCKRALFAARDAETCDAAAFALGTMCENFALAEKDLIPVCQDTGMCVVFLEIGGEVRLEGGFLPDEIDAAVARAYVPLRKSVLDPVSRINTGTNTPAVLHTRFVKGGEVKIEVMLKGFGSENMSAVAMLNPAQGIEEAKRVIVDTVARAGSNPCPPVIVGVGLGGTFEKCAEMSKHALFRKIGSRNPDPDLDALEKELLGKINLLGIGAQGFGGKTTALGVFIEKFPTHISSLPVAVNILCHCSRAKTIFVGEKGVRYE